MHGFSGLEKLYVAILYCLRLGDLKMDGFSHSEGFYVVILYCFRVGRSRDVIQRNSHFGGPIERKVSDLEGCHVANPDV